MKKVALLVCLVSAMAVAGFAANCPNTTYDNYIVSGFTCEIGNQTFMDFAYSGTAIPQQFAVPAGSIVTTPLNDSGGTGFQWSAPWGVSTSGGVLAQDSLFQFNVTSTTPMTDLSLTIAGVGFAGTGAVIVDETACLGALLPTCSGGTEITLRVFESSDGTQLVDQVNFAGVNLISIDKDVELTAGTAGNASLSVVTDQISEGTSTVPEPGTLSMLGIGALGLVGFARRKMRL